MEIHVATYEFYRKPVAGLRTKGDVLKALHEALDEVQADLQQGNVSPADIAEALTFLKRYYERLERLILSEGVIDHRELIRLQKNDPLLQQAKRRFERQQARLNSRVCR